MYKLYTAPNSRHNRTQQRTLNMTCLNTTSNFILISWEVWENWMIWFYFCLTGDPQPTSRPLKIVPMGEGPGVLKSVFRLVASCPSNMLVCLRDQSLRQFYTLPHWDRSCRSNFLSHPVTRYRHWANQSQPWPYNGKRLAWKPLECQFLSHLYDSTWKNPHSESGNRTLEVDALTTRPARQCVPWSMTDIQQFDQTSCWQCPMLKFSLCKMAP